LRGISITQEDHHHHPKTGCNKYIIDPTGKFRTTWDIFISLFVMYLLIKVPLVLFPGDLLNKGFWKTFDVFLDVFFWTDLVLNFRTGFVHFKHVEMDWKHIAKHYLAFWFWIDILACIPFETIFDGLYTDKRQRKIVKLWKIFKLSKLLRITRVVKLMKDFFKYRYFIFLSGWTCIATHILTCGWAGIEANNKPLQYDLVSNGTNSAEELYLKVLDDVYSKMFMADSELRVEHTDERVFIVFALCLGILVVGFAGGLVVSLLSGVSASREQFRAKMVAVKEEVHELNLDHKLTHDVEQFYETLWEDTATREFTLHRDPDLTTGLRIKLANELSIRLFPINQIPMFEHANKHFVMKVMLALQTEILIPGEYLMRQGTASDSLFFLYQGEVEILIDEGNGKSKVCDVEQQGSFLGTSALYSNATRNASVRALTICNVKKLTKTELFIIIQEFPEFEKTVMRFIKDNEAAEEPTFAMMAGFTGDMSPRMLKLVADNLNGQQQSSSQSDVVKIMNVLRKQSAQETLKLRNLVDSLSAVQLQISHLKHQVDSSRQLHM